MTRLAHATLAAALLAASLLPACGGSAPPAEPVPPPTPVAAIDTPPPEFPLALACAGVGGQTLLSVEIGAEGRPTRIDLVRGSGNAELDALASQATLSAATYRVKPSQSTAHSSPASSEGSANSRRASACAVPGWTALKRTPRPGMASRWTSLRKCACALSEISIMRVF